MNTTPSADSAWFTRFKRAFNIRRWRLPYIISLAILAVSIWYAYGLRSSLSELNLTQTRISAVVTLSILHILNLAMSSLIFKTLVDRLVAGLKLSEYFSLTVVTNLMSYLSPGRLGTVGKGVYLKRRLQLPYSRFSSYFVGQSVFMVMTATVGGMIATWMTSVNLLNSVDASRLFLLFGALFVVSLVPLIWVPSLPLLENAVLRFVRSLAEGWKSVRTDHHLVIWIIVLNLANLIVAALIAQTMFDALGVEVSFWAGLLIGVFGTLSSYVNLTPANLGIKEIFLASISEILGFSFSFGIAAATLNRLVEAGVVLILAPASAYWLGKVTRAKG